MDAITYAMCKNYTNKKVAESAGLHREIVNSLPATGDENIIYMVLDQTASSPDIYDEWMWINGAYEHIGSTRVDLTDYYNKTQVDTALSGKQDTLSYDNVPTQNSNNMVKSGGIFSAMAVPKYDSANRREYFEGGAAFGGNIDSTPTAGNNNAVASGGTKTYVDNAVSYKAGDVIANENVVAAAVGSNANDCYFSIPLSKPVVASSVSISNVTCSVYYGTNQKETVSGATYTGTIKKCSILIKMTKANTFTQNGRYAVDFNGTFTFS